ncbi:MAG: sulfur carrier protein ThiS [Candidatus Entotheonella gemina]|uniref:Sulfur carrier protein ThiS n=1 Tax=Candidatus Entotheonella gemina TaxID=1429439 RepID=W4M0U6_9BACT|nr:MAG: sulfur carrier protein ThiS [Candidatus Entotheonella gemina]
MEVTVKLFASLGKYLPPGAKRNETVMEIADDVSVDQLITQLNLPRELTHLVLINGIYIEPEKREKTTFSPGDEFAVFPPIAGG